MFRWLWNRLMDWLIAIFICLFLVWFAATQPVWQARDHSLIVAVSSDMLKRHVRHLSTELPTRRASSLDSTAAYIYQQFEDIGGKNHPPRYQEYEALGGSHRNVILDLGPDTQEVFVVGAHYDSFEGYPGADGNASGVAGLLELARLLVGNSPPLSMRVQLVAYPLKEKPFFDSPQMGSYVHARHLFETRKEVALMISLDTIGYYTKKHYTQAYPYGIMRLFYPEHGDFIMLTGRLGWHETLAVRSLKSSFRKTSKLRVRSLSAPELLPTIDQSDHRSYWKMGFPAVMVTDTGSYRNPNYHTPKDTWHHLDYLKMAQVVKGVYQTVIEYQD